MKISPLPLLQQMQVSHLCTHTHTSSSAHTHTETPTHTCKHFLRAPLLPSPCPMWPVASAARPLTVVMVWNIPVAPAGLPSPLCLRVPCKAPCFPASCFPQVLSTDRGYEGEEEAGKQTLADLLLPDGVLLIGSSQIPAMVLIFSRAPEHPPPPLRRQLRHKIS